MLFSGSRLDDKLLDPVHNTPLSTGAIRGNFQVKPTTLFGRHLCTKIQPMRTFEETKKKINKKKLLLQIRPSLEDENCLRLVMKDGEFDKSHLRFHHFNAIDLVTVIFNVIISMHLI